MSNNEISGNIRWQPHAANFVKRGLLQFDTSFYSSFVGWKLVMFTMKTNQVVNLSVFQLRLHAYNKTAYKLDVEAKNTCAGHSNMFSWSVITWTFELAPRDCDENIKAKVTPMTVGRWFIGRYWWRNQRPYKTEKNQFKAIQRSVRLN